MSLCSTSLFASPLNIAFQSMSGLAVHSLPLREALIYLLGYVKIQCSSIVESNILYGSSIVLKMHGDIRKFFGAVVKPRLVEREKEPIAFRESEAVISFKQANALLGIPFTALSWASRSV
jgi:hypothetical protein